ncbi:proton-coupled amino acid transporter-like protein CG1139 isoform X2 [Toxorhynchites rutilus septentrionalis]|nr:proton-coupled amino acid transporter-like protein CG1139 isoform X2 [Toxorhynchites rutilus septentrionalis]XP_055616743.1 proton-coupled amino acid transporter-like protein CG1139 isoform X2 [Toxorhynchites rutilus septentrionalis]XP_055616744.1 proton-coupled amino acid transporter-like protein CG1139 isoform X2 [Toxorhynchites rutilus septentrionalis]
MTNPIEPQQTAIGLDVIQRNGANGGGEINRAFELSDPEGAKVPRKGRHDASGVNGQSGGAGGAGVGGGGHGIESDHPTSYLETIMHIFKGNVGPGLYAMGQAFMNGGIVVAPILTVLLGITCVHSQHLLLKCAAKMKSKQSNANQLPDFAETVELCFEHGPVRMRGWSRVMRLAVNVFICVTQLGFCTVYFGFISNNLKHIYDYYGIHLDVRLHMLIILVPILLPSLIRNLKYLAWCMTLANACMILGICITAYYAVQELPPIGERPYFSSLHQLPLYFGTAIFAFEGIALVLPLQNAMKTPTDFGRPLGVLNVGMAIVTFIFASLGFLGYLKWGDDVQSSLTLNLPKGEILAQSVKVMVSLGILLGYALQFFVAIQIMLPWVLARISYSAKHPIRVELLFRTLIVLITFAVAESILNVGALISLIGALCSTALALVFPPVLELILGLAESECEFPQQPTDGSAVGGSKIGFVIWVKNLLILVLALFIFLTGTVESLNEIRHIA